MKWKNILSNVIGKLGQAGIKRAEEAISKLEGSVDEPWKKTVLIMVGEAVDKYGIEGIQRVQDAIDNVNDGKKPDLSFASLRVRSDFLADLQNMEADKKSKARDFLRLIGETLGVIIGVIMKGIVK